MITHQQYFKPLSGLRGLGAIWVTLFHVCFQSVNPLISAGYLGVDLFFLLSGFIISHVHRQDFARGYSFAEHRRFLQLRLLRIYPLHVFVLVLFAIFVLTATNFTQQYSHPERFGIAPFLASLFLVHNWGFGQRTVWNGPTWSLSAEWLAYLLFPLMSIAVSKIKPKYSLLTAFLALVTLESILFFTKVPMDGVGKTGLLRIIFEFLAGCLLYRYASFDKRRSTHSLGWLAIGMLVASILVPQFHYFAPISFALLIIAVVSQRGSIERILSSRPLLFLGDVSFSLYMCHGPLIQVRNWAVTQRYVGEHEALAVLVIAICLSAVFCWKYVEVPARKFGRQLMHNKICRAVKIGSIEIPHDSVKVLASEPGPDSHASIGNRADL